MNRASAIPDARLNESRVRIERAGAIWMKRARAEIDDHVAVTALDAVAQINHEHALLAGVEPGAHGIAGGARSFGGAINTGRTARTTSRNRFPV